MPIYEFLCETCGETTSIFKHRYEVPSGVACESCGAQTTRLVISGVATKVARDAKYSEDFTGKMLPYLRHKFPGEFEKKPKGESEEAVAHNINEKIGTQVDRVIEKTIRDINKSR
jgi:putative FmdB family regulatory protein